MLITISGPEKVGKTTLANNIRPLTRGAANDGGSAFAIMCSNRRPRVLDIAIYHREMELAHRSDTAVIMDRSWIDEIVYNCLLHRPTGWAAQPFWLEWTLGTPAQMLGNVMIVAPPERYKQLEHEDHQIPYHEERAAFMDHAEKYGYPIVQAPEQLDLDTLIQTAIAKRNQSLPLLPSYVGPLAPQVVIVCWSRPHKKHKAAWVVASTPSFFIVPKTLEKVGVNIHHVGRMDISVAKEHAEILDQARLVVTMGPDVTREVAKLLPNKRVLDLPHLADLYREQVDPHPYMEMLAKVIMGELK